MTPAPHQPSVPWAHLSAAVGVERRECCLRHLLHVLVRAVHVARRATLHADGARVARATAAGGELVISWSAGEARGSSSVRARLSRDAPVVHVADHVTLRLQRFVEAELARLQAEELL